MIRFFEQHPWLLTDPVVGPEARRQLRLHRASLARQTRRVTGLRERAAPRAGDPARCRRFEKAGPAEGNLPRVRHSLLRRGAPCRPLRVGSPAHRAERPVPRALPDGLVRAAPVRPRPHRLPAGARRRTATSSSRGATGAPGRASPGTDAAVELWTELWTGLWTDERDRAISCANCGTRAAPRVPRAPSAC